MVRAATSEAVLLGQVATAAALGWAVTRHSVQHGHCHPRDIDSYQNYRTHTWCDRVPPVQQVVRETAIGAIPLTGVTALGLATMSPNAYESAFLSLLLVAQVAVPAFYAPTGGAIGAHMFRHADVTTSTVQSAVYGGMTIIGIEIGLVLVLMGTALLCGGVALSAGGVRDYLHHSSRSLRRAQDASDLEHQRPNHHELAAYPMPPPIVATPPAAHVAPDASAHAEGTQAETAAPSDGSSAGSKDLAHLGPPAYRP